MATSFRLTQLVRDASEMPMLILKKKPHESHPSLDHLTLLVFEAVLEVVCVSLPGYIVARLGQFDADKQKFLANLNVMLFTPCLIFTKLASQLNADKLGELAIIPVIFVVQTLVSWIVSTVVARAFGFNKRASNFVTAMGVFGNSNSLPISLVLSLSQTLKGLHWDKIPGDNDDEVAARGILYLMIFQQLGQLVRWSWGYHVLLAPKEKYPEYRDEVAEEGRGIQSGHEEGVLIPGLDGEEEIDDEHGHGHGHGHEHSPITDDGDHFVPAGRTPVAGTSTASPADSDDEEDPLLAKGMARGPLPFEGNKPVLHGPEDDILSFPRIRSADEGDFPDGVKGYWPRIVAWVKGRYATGKSGVGAWSARVHSRLPKPLQNLTSASKHATIKVYYFLWDFMNPPLWAMLIAVVVASVPSLQRIFFEEGSFIKNSVTSAVQSSAGVAVPLILVVLGANLARNTQKRDGLADPEEDKIGRKLLIASLISRMVLPTVIMAPFLAIMAKYVPISILDDPIFVIVCFLLTGAPSALQLAQICQINSVYEGVMSKILFQSYVIWILPSTLVLVMCALEVVEWAKPI